MANPADVRVWGYSGYTGATGTWGYTNRMWGVPGATEGFSYQIKLLSATGVHLAWLQNITESCTWNFKRFGGCGDCSLTVLADYGTLTQITAGCRIQIYINNSTSTDYDHVYTGYVSSKSPVYGSVEKYNIRVLGFSSQMQRIVIGRHEPRQYLSGAYITDIVRDIAEHVICQDTNIAYNGGAYITASGEDPGECSVTTQGPYPIQEIATEAVDKLAKIAGDYEWGVDKNMYFYFLPASTTSQHFWVGRNVEGVQVQEDYEGIKNRIFVNDGFFTDTYEADSDMATINEASQLNTTSHVHYSAVADGSPFAKFHSDYHPFIGGEYVTNAYTPGDEATYVGNFYVTVIDADEYKLSAAWPASGFLAFASGKTGAGITYTDVLPLACGASADYKAVKQTFPVPAQASISRITIKACLAGSASLTEFIADGDMSDAGVADWDDVGFTPEYIKDSKYLCEGTQSLKVVAVNMEGVSQDMDPGTTVGLYTLYWRHYVHLGGMKVIIFSDATTDVETESVVFDAKESAASKDPPWQLRSMTFTIPTDTTSTKISFVGAASGRTNTGGRNEFYIGDVSIVVNGLTLRAYLCNTDVDNTIMAAPREVLVSSTTMADYVLDFNYYRGVEGDGVTTYALYIEPSASYKDDTEAARIHFRLAYYNLAVITGGLLYYGDLTEWHEVINYGVSSCSLIMKTEYNTSQQLYGLREIIQSPVGRGGDLQNWANSYLAGISQSFRRVSCKLLAQRNDIDNHVPATAGLGSITIRGMFLESSVSSDSFTAFYKFEAGALETNSSFSGHTLTAIGSPAADASGEIGGCVNLDASSAYKLASGESHADFEPAGAFSVGGWIRKAGGTGTDYIIANFNFIAGTMTASGWCLSITPTTGIVSFHIYYNDVLNGSSIFCETAISNDTWAHVVGTYDGTHLRIYLNGVSDATPVDSNPAGYDSDTHFRVGCFSTGTGTGTNASFFTGKLDEMFFIKDRCLTASEITDIYANTTRTEIVEANAIDTIDYAITENGLDISVASGQRMPSIAYQLKFIEHRLSSLMSM